ncbi:MAG: hypothetical protein SFY81_07315 [Verrucomicrobiota bacterium]|nr:hypothetical protein [Verrucomicrobiota bacterium]
MPFNRFHVERIDSIIVNHFALLSPTGVVMDRFSTAIFNVELEIQRASLLEHFKKAGNMGDTPPPWQPPATAIPIELFNQVILTSHPEVAETLLNNFSRTTGATLPIEGIALLRSTPEVQRHWIKALLE